MPTNTELFLKITRDVRAQANRKMFVIAATKRNYFCLSRMFKDAQQTFKSGRRLKDFVLAYAFSGTWYNPLGSFSVTSRDPMREIEVPWAYHEINYPLVEEEEDNNEGDDNAFVDYVSTLDAACLTGLLNDMESSCWALPNFETMEQAASGEEGQRPFSMLCFATRDGLAPSSSNGGVAPGSSNWTTLQTLNVAAEPWFQNATENYDATDPFNATPGTGQGILPAFDRTLLKVGYETPDELQKYADSLDRQQQAIVTNHDGSVLYDAVLRANNDRMAALNDPAIRGPQFRGIAVKAIDELNNVGWTAWQPDFIWAHFGAIRPFVHRKRFMADKTTGNSHDHPNKTVQWKFTQTNRICRDRRRLARVSAA